MKISNFFSFVHFLSFSLSLSLSFFPIRVKLWSQLIFESARLLYVVTRRPFRTERKTKTRPSGTPSSSREDERTVKEL